MSSGSKSSRVQTRSSGSRSPPPDPVLKFIHRRFTWTIEHSDFKVFVKHADPRELTSRKFRTVIQPLGSRTTTIGWRVDLGFCDDDNGDHRHIRVTPSFPVSSLKLDVLALVRLFLKSGMAHQATFFSFQRLEKGKSVDFQLNTATIRELEKNRGRGDVVVEVVLMFVNEYKDESGVKDLSIMDQVKESEGATNGKKGGDWTNHRNACRSFDRVLRPDSNHFSDVTLLVNNEEQSEQTKVQRFFCHRFILAQESPVFERLFTGNAGFVENRDGEVRIKDVDPEIMTEFLHLVYTGCFKVSNRKQPFLESLVGVAEKYQVDRMKRLCELRLLAALNGEMSSSGLVDALIHAHLYRLHRLKAVLLPLVAWTADVLLEEAVSGGKERMKKLQGYPELLVQVTRVLAELAHSSCDELALHSMSDDDTSDARSRRSSSTTDFSSMDEA